MKRPIIANKSTTDVAEISLLSISHLFFHGNKLKKKQQQKQHTLHETVQCDSIWLLSIIYTFKYLKPIFKISTF